MDVSVSLTVSVCDPRQVQCFLCLLNGRKKNTNFFIFKIKNGITQKEENNHGHATFSHGHAAVAVGLYL